MGRRCIECDTLLSMNTSLVHKKGFTLIEIMIVITIVATLSSVVVIGIGDAQKKGKVAKVQTDLAQLKVALANYYSVRGTYPLIEAGNRSYMVESVSSKACAENPSDRSWWIPGLAPQYIGELPEGPYGSTEDCAADRQYIYASDGRGYFLLFGDSTICEAIIEKDASMEWTGSVQSFIGKSCGYWTNDAVAASKNVPSDTPKKPIIIKR